MANGIAGILHAAEGCLPIPELVSRLEGESGQSPKEACEEHVSRCAHCAAELALLREFVSQDVQATEREPVHSIVKQLRKNSPVKQEWWWKHPRMPGILAPASLGLAAAVLALTVGLHTAPSFREPVAVQAGELTRGAHVAVMGPSGDTARRPSEFRWQPVAGASRYQVRLLEADRTELWSAAVAAASVALPEETRRSITPGKRLIWDVTAFDETGNVITTSGLTSFRVVGSN